MVSARELVSSLKGTLPPYVCPVCEKVYKSWCGIEYHLLRFPHEGVERLSTTRTPSSKRTKTKRGRGRTKNKRAKSPPPQPSVVRETLTYAQAQKMVEFDFAGHLQRLDIGDSLGILEEPVHDENGGQDETDGQTPKSTSKTKAKSKSKNKSKSGNEVQPAVVGLPKPDFRLDDEFCELDAPSRSTTYFRFIERTSEELDEEVEYSADDEDAKWLKVVNEKRKTEGLATVSQDVFELLMDRLEKESHFESQNTCDPNQYIDEDAVCCICNDGECANSNVILFCDMCNLAVHQECYGVPYIPEGQWLCRRCLNSPSKPVDCVLCPNKTGAFKQTDDNRWAHVVCALWIPEVCFANTVFLEPIDSLQNIPSARWKLRCYICRKTQGACIQCSKTNCYTAFHVTCAQQAGLHLKIEPTRSDGGQPAVKKSAFCDVHSPGLNNQSANGSTRESEDDGDEKVPPSKATPINQKMQKDLKEIRKRLSEKHPTVPIVNIPFVPAHRISKIVSRVAVQKKSQFIQCLQAYWMLKRQSRNGVPLLRRLQATHQNRASGPEDQQRRERIAAMKEQLHFWQRLRHDLERARLLVELIRKREKLKREHLKSHISVVDLRMKPLTTVLSKTLTQLQAKDPGQIFLEPVDTDEVLDYLDVITEPMDFMTMREKIDGNVYKTFDEFEKDFNLIWKNCMAYNGEDTIYYRAAVRLRDQGKTLVRSARRMVERTGIDPETGLLTPDVPTVKDRELTQEDFILTEEQRKDMSLEEQLKDLNEKLEMTQAIKSGSARAQRNRQIRKEVACLRRKINLQQRESISEPSVVDSEDGLSPAKKPKLSPETTPTSHETPNLTTASDMSEISLVTNPRDAERDAEPVGNAASTPSITNPRPGTNRRSGILFNKNKFRARHNVHMKNNDKDLGTNLGPPVFENGDVPEVLGKNGDVRRKSTASDSNDENNWSNLNRLVYPEDTQGNEGYPGRKTSRLNSYPEDVPEVKEIPAVEPHRNNFKENSRPKPRLSRSNTSGSEDATEKKTNDLIGFVKKRGRKARSRCNSEEDINTTDSECNGGVYSPRNSDTEPDMLEFLELVWAKCRGYPSYPALIINPKTKRGFVHKGVPIPVPPDDVLKERRPTDEHLYLVLFFDARRTWQWLPRQKLSLLGQNNGVDNTKLYEGKKPSLRKSVQQAFARALAYKQQITAQREDEEANGFLENNDEGGEGEEEIEGEC